MFSRIDTGGDRKVNIYEFKAALPLIEKWGVKIEDPKKTFKEIDTNNGGEILFDDFCHFAIKKNLDLENDDDFDDEELKSMK
jgi:Ca2+-binding EF-hand superfamily protein